MKLTKDMLMSKIKCIIIEQENENHKKYYRILKNKYNMNIDEYEPRMDGGQSARKKPTDFPLDALIKGIDVEHKEHGGGANYFIAMEIAMDHLTEDPRYYDFLEDMEKEMKGSENEESIS